MLSPPYPYSICNSCDTATPGSGDLPHVSILFLA